MAKTYFNKEEQLRIVQAIREAELQTSGEIRVHVEPEVDGDAFEQARKLFFMLGMDQTREKNGVLIYLAMESRKFAIIGDEGIHLKVKDVFWQEEKSLLSHWFRKGEYTKGLELAIEQIGKRLKEFFPYTQDDKNELSDSISFGGGANE